VNLEVNIASLRMKNPFTVASGTFAPGKGYAAVWKRELISNADSYPASFDPSAPLAVLGALTTKGVSSEPWEGNKGIRITETSSGILNSIGLQNPGVEDFCVNELVWLASQSVPIIVNVCGHTVADYAAVVERLEQEKAVDAYELNVSCPNVDCGGMSFGTSSAAVFDLVTACRVQTKRPIIVKLTPNVTDITEIARACESSGADALSLINTVAGMAIDVRKRAAVFDRKVAGLSGPAIKPVALYAVYRVHKAVAIPIIGMGGISSAEDVVEFLLAGATAIAIGTYNFTNPLAILHLLPALTHWCEKEGVTHLSDLTGALK